MELTDGFAPPSWDYETHVLLIELGQRDYLKLINEFLRDGLDIKFLNFLFCCFFKKP